MGNRKSFPTNMPEEYAVTTDCGRHATKWHAQILSSIRWRACDQTMEATRSSKIVIFEESGVAESHQHAVVARAIWEVQSTARTFVHACQERHRVQLTLTHTQ